MKQYRYNGLDIVEGNNLIWIKNVRDGNIIFSTRDGETSCDFGVKFLNRYSKIYHNEPRNDFIEMLSYSLVTHGVKYFLLGFFCGLVLKGPAIKLN